MVDTTKRELKSGVGGRPMALAEPVTNEPGTRPTASDWKRLMDLERKEITTDVLAITRPRTAIDPLAKKGLEALFKAVTGNDKSEAVQLEKELRRKITDLGVASEVSRITNRLNSRRMTDARRWVLAETYAWLLGQLLNRKSPAEVEKLLADELGVAEELMLAVDANDGALDKLAHLLVQGVIDKNKFNVPEEQQERAAQQVRGAI